MSSNLPRWRVIIEKMLNGEYWVNTYWVEHADIQGAGAVAAQILQIERQVTLTPVTFTKYRVDDNVPDTDNYVTVPANVSGAFVGTLSTMLPLFNVAVVDFSVATGRPARKFLRGVLYEEGIAEMKLTTALVTHINTNYSTPMANLTGYINVDGQQIISGAVKLEPGMRQLRRKKRRTLPVI